MSMLMQHFASDSIHSGGIQATAAKTYTWEGEAYGPDGTYVPKTYEVPGPLYHGSRAKNLREGDMVTPGRRTNYWGDEGPTSSHVYFTQHLDSAAAYANSAGGHVYEVEPTGDFRQDYGGGDYKSQHPLRVVRRLDPREWRGQRKQASGEDYQSGHQPLDDTDQLHDLGGHGTLPPDVYDHPDWYGWGDHVGAHASIIHRVKGKPNARVTVYRAVPHDVHDINNGDWVAIHPSYAREHAMRTDDPKDDWKVLKTTTEAKNIRTGGGDIMEWGYWGPGHKNAPVHAPGGSRARAEYERSQKALAQGRSDYWPKQVEEGLELHQTHAVHLDPDTHALVHDPNASRIDKANAVAEHLRKNPPYWLGHPTWHDDYRSSLANPHGEVDSDKTLVTMRFRPTVDQIHGGEGNEVWLKPGSRANVGRIDLHDHKGKSLGGAEVEPLTSKIGKQASQTHSYYRGLHLGQDTKSVFVPDEGIGHSESVPADHSDQGILDAMSQHHEWRMRGREDVEPQDRWPLYGSHWTGNHDLARRFALDPSHGNWRVPPRPTKPVTGVVLEAQSSVSPEADPLASQYGETEVKWSGRKSVDRVIAHVHRWDPEIHGRDHRVPTYVRSFEVPPEHVQKFGRKQAVQQRPDPDPVEYRHVEPPGWGGDFTGGFHSMQARLDGKQVGYLHWWDPGEGPWKGIKGPAVEKVEVAPAHRRRGLAAEMLRRAQEITPGIGPSDELTADGRAWRDAVHPESAGTPFRPSRMLPRLSSTIDDIMGLLGPAPKPPQQPSEEERARQDAEHAERVRKHQEWQATRKGYSPGDDLSDWQGYPHAEWVPIGVAQYFREHTADQHKASEQTVQQITEQLKAGRGMTDPLMLLHHNEKNRASLGEGNHRLVAAERAGWTHVPMRVVRMYDGEAERGEGRSIPHAWRGSLEGRTPELARPSEVFHPSALDSRNP